MPKFGYSQWLMNASYMDLDNRILFDLLIAKSMNSQKYNIFEISFQNWFELSE